MFSKALFKQSCKANGTMWAIITFAVCFMLACVMLISGNGNIGEVKNSIQDTIITQEVDAQMQKRALSYYAYSTDGLEKFDELFAQKATDTVTYLGWLSNKPNQSEYQNETDYLAELNAWQARMPTLNTTTGKTFVDAVTKWLQSTPNEIDFDSPQDYMSALQSWQAVSPATVNNAVALAYADSCEDLQLYLLSKAVDEGYEIDSTQAQEIVGSVMYVLNPNGTFNDFYIENGEEAPDEYDVTSIVEHVAAADVTDFISGETREEYRSDRCVSGSAIFIAGNMTKEENVKVLTEALSSYGVTKEKYDSFGYDYASIKKMATTAIVTYEGRVSYELDLIKQEYDNGNFLTENDYLSAIETKKQELASDISSSFLSTLPSTVSDALEEIGKTDLYTLIVGSIFYKLAGLLLPIIYMIMASNNLISGQVDSGSMAYVLSTSTKRSSVVFTQAVYLVGSLLAMFACTTITGCVCLAIITEEVGLTFGNLILLNVGAFLVLFALSGLCFFTSCYFDRSKRSMAIGGGLSIFALVAAMLGLFGSPVIPSVVRLEALNYFNYTTIISLFDVISIMDGSITFVWKFVILAVAGIIGYVIGSIKFVKKDLPL